MTVFWVVLDGAAAWVVDGLVERGRLPALAQVRTAGTYGALEPPSPNCQTPPARWAPWTGARPIEEGLLGLTWFSRKSHSTSKALPLLS